MILRSEEEMPSASPMPPNPAGALAFAISTTERMLRDAPAPGHPPPRNKYSDALNAVCVSLVEVVGQFRP